MDVKRSSAYGNIEQVSWMTEASSWRCVDCEHVDRGDMADGL